MAKLARSHLAGRQFCLQYQSCLFAKKFSGVGLQVVVNLQTEYDGPLPSVVRMRDFTDFTLGLSQKYHF